MILLLPAPMISKQSERLLNHNFKLKDLGFPKYFLGFEIARNSSGISFCQRKYALDILSDSGMLGCQPAKSPVDQNLRFDTATGDVLSDPTSFRWLIGRLLY